MIMERIGDIPRSGQEQDCPGYYDYIHWCSKTCEVIDQVYGPGDIHSEELRITGLTGCACSPGSGTKNQIDAVCYRLLSYIDEIRAEYPGEE